MNEIKSIREAYEHVNEAKGIVYGKVDIAYIKEVQGIMSNLRSKYVEFESLLKKVLLGGIPKNLKSEIKEFKSEVKTWDTLRLLPADVLSRIVVDDMYESMNTYNNSSTQSISQIYENYMINEVVVSSGKHQPSLDALIEVQSKMNEIFTLFKTIKLSKLPDSYRSPYNYTTGIKDNLKKTKEKIVERKRVIDEIIKKYKSELKPVSAKSKTTTTTTITTKSSNPTNPTTSDNKLDGISKLMKGNWHMNSSSNDSFFITVDSVNVTIKPSDIKKYDVIYKQLLTMYPKTKKIVVDVSHEDNYVDRWFYDVFPKSWNLNTDALNPNGSYSSQFTAKLGDLKDLTKLIAKNSGEDSDKWGGYWLHSFTLKLRTGK